MSQASAPRRTPVKAAIASWVGTTLEYYDFAVYGTAASLVFNRIFFPDVAPGIGVLLSIATFGVAFAVRPLGAFVLGPLADRYGRKFVLMLTLFGIGACTFLIGCLPSYDQIGVWAPILLVILRCVQGLSVSGEQAAAITMSLEHAPDDKRAFTTSFTTSGSASGGLLAFLVFIPFVALPDEQLLSWGWRVPFWLSAVVVVVAYLVRRKLEEPPAFLDTQAVKVSMPPMKQALRFHWKAIVRIACCALIAGVSYVFATFSIAFATTGYGLSSSTMLWVPVCAMTVAMLYTPVAGRVADKLGARNVFIIGALGAGLTMVPYLWSITTGDWALIFTLGIINNGFFYSTANAAWPAFFAEMVPSRVRVSGLATGTQIGFAIAGAAVPALSTALAGEQLVNWAGPASIAAGIAVIATVAALTAKSTRKYTLDELDDVLQSDAEKEAVTASIVLPKN